MEVIFMKQNNSASLSATDQQHLNEIKDAIQRNQKAYAQSFYEIGLLLLQAKHLLVKHGAWQAWLEKNTDFSLCKAERLMRTARFLQESAPGLNLNFSQAHVLTALPPKEISNFLSQTHWVPKKNKYMRVEEMSKRDLETAVRNCIKNLNLKSNTGQASKKPDSPTTSPNSITAQCEKIRSSINNLVNLVEKKPKRSGSHDLLIDELRNLCTEILQKLPYDKLEDL